MAGKDQICVKQLFYFNKTGGFGCRVVQQEILHQPCNTVGRKGDNMKYIFNFVLFKFIVFAHVQRK